MLGWTWVGVVDDRRGQAESCQDMSKWDGGLHDLYTMEIGDKHTCGIDKFNQHRKFDSKAIIHLFPRCQLN